MKNILCIDKPIGLTPLQTLDGLREKFPEYKNEKLSYAGRLDPMANGVMLVLVGEENKNRKEHLGADKEYEFEVLFGLKSDTYDLMGMPEKVATDFDEGKLADLVVDLEGKIEQVYPPYSGKTINGVKMFELAKKGMLPDELPKLEGNIRTAEVLGVRSVEFDRVSKYVSDAVSKVKGDFRQEEILAAWRNIDIKKDDEFTLVNIRLSCSSGVFMRGIADDLGRKMVGAALAYSIKRTKVGKYNLNDCIRI